MHPTDQLLRIILPSAGAAIVAALLMVGWTTDPNKLALGYAPKQPIPFSHAVHAGKNKIPCQYCHIGVMDSRFAGIPSVESCMNCHRVAKPGTDLIRELTRIYDEALALKWERVHRLPDHVYFDHRPHVAAGIACEVCHGEVAEMEVLEQSMSMRMGNCLDCHRDVHSFIKEERYREPLAADLKGAEHCAACHR